MGVYSGISGTIWDQMDNTMSWLDGGISQYSVGERIDNLC
jgi:hypothetical protein